MGTEDGLSVLYSHSGPGGSQPGVLCFAPLPEKNSKLVVLLVGWLLVSGSDPDDSMHVHRWSVMCSGLLV